MIPYNTAHKGTPQLFESNPIFDSGRTTAFVSIFDYQLGYKSLMVYLPNGHRDANQIARAGSQRRREHTYLLRLESLQ